tara:strand:- start:577 stop:900 length:324 start_codon:yes stop_codon:yes gene_type:complete
MKESIYGSDYLIGVSELGTNVREITLLGLLNEAGVLNGISQQEINDINNLSVVWDYVDGDVDVEQIYNYDTGEVYWEDHDENWTDNDELILNSLLMYGDLESSIVWE